jgi:hypothetical protein
MQKTCQRSQSNASRITSAFATQAPRLRNTRSLCGRAEIRAFDRARSLPCFPAGRLKKQSGILGAGAIGPSVSGAPMQHPCRVQWTPQRWSEFRRASGCETRERSRPPCNRLPPPETPIWRSGRSNREIIPGPTHPGRMTDSRCARSQGGRRRAPAGCPYRK